VFALYEKLYFHEIDGRTAIDASILQECSCVNAQSRRETAVGNTPLRDLRCVAV
jgi:hypothetical protein